MHEMLDVGLRYAFEEQDKPMILAQYEALSGEDFWDLEPLILACDAGAVRARRILRKLIHEEQLTSGASSSSSHTQDGAELR